MVLNVEEPLLLNDTEQSFSTDVYEEFNMTGISFCYSFLIDTVLSIEMVKKMASSVLYHHHNVEIKSIKHIDTYPRLWFKWLLFRHIY